MTKRIGVWVVIGLLAAYPAMGYAAEHAGKTVEGGSKILTLSTTSNYTPSPWTTQVGYKNRACGKLAFGLKNALLGWTELVTEPKEALDVGDNFFVGLFKGLRNGVVNELGGVIHLVTFPFTNLDAPLPGGGIQFL